MLVELGNAYGDANQFDKKRDCLNRALHIQEREYGPTHAQCAVLLANLGNAYAQLGDPKADACYERALMIHEREYGPKHRALIKKARGFASSERARDAMDPEVDAAKADTSVPAATQTSPQRTHPRDLFSSRSGPRTPSEVSRMVLWMGNA